MESKVLAMDSLTVSNGNFTLDLFKTLTRLYPGKNLFFSSWSISSAMAMIYLGARSETATQMAQVLHFNRATESSSQKPDSKDEEVHLEFQVQISEINQPNSSYLLKTANRLYGEKTYPFLREYIELTKKYYHAEAQEVNFFSAAERVRREINLWVESQTDHKIKDLLPKDAVDSQTALVLVNAIYFKGKWENRFQKEDTTKADFRLSKTTSTSVQMMFLKGAFPFFHISILKVEILELPYVNNDLSMLILLPNDITDESTGLELLEKELTYERLSIWTSPEMMEKVNVEVHLPKIKLAESYNLKTTLSSMGMTNAFSQGQANFTGMSDRNDLYLSQVFHKSFVEVNEEGTEASSATAGVVTIRTSQQPVVFKADHPFLFLIRHNKTKSILFFGKFCAP
ncbi:serpin B10-like [Eublepharis macularius]|uniref:Serpin B10 n=1 Tax=Eublepharis macularius TaxID=481883 RepID=A0AA97JP91_EUBMA|nr:serpin B10-like [Eublepharis macularius]